MSKGNVIDFSAHLKKKVKVDSEKSNVKASVLDMVERRQAAIKQERRAIKRTILTEFIGFKLVLPEKGLLDVSLYDISENGLSFEHDSKLSALSVGNEVAARIYLTHESYFAFNLKITNIRMESDEGIFRYGTTLVKDDFNKEALTNFVKFIESVSANLRSDKGDLVTRIIR